jgi:DotD protein
MMKTKVKTRTVAFIVAMGILGGVGAMSGCATAVAKVEQPTVDPQVTELNAIATHVSTQLDRLIRLERGLPEKGMETAAKTSSLKTVLTVQWSGTGEALAKGVAEQVGFRFITSGTAPFTPVVVPLDAQDRTAEVVLRVIADRMARVAEIRVSEKQKTIELAYRRP